MVQLVAVEAVVVAVVMDLDQQVAVEAAAAVMVPAAVELATAGLDHYMPVVAVDLRTVVVVNLVVLVLEVLVVPAAQLDVVVAAVNEVKVPVVVERQVLLSVEMDL
jgi:hypothetical protein